MPDTCPVCGMPGTVEGGETKCFVPEYTPEEIKAMKEFIAAYDKWACLDAGTIEEGEAFRDMVEARGEMDE